MSAGKMDYRVAFDQATGTVTPTGGQVTAWVEQIAGVWAAITFLRGGETVIAARLTGRQPAVVRVRASAATRAITTEWRMRDLRAGTVYAIRSIIETDNRAYLDLTCESGVFP
jgi:SPP1 family predicted phage head-tail adaptor